MLIREDNELLCRVGPGTPMGDLMREYWQPVLFSSEVPEPDGEPLRVRHLGENLIAFRDTGGRMALLADNCPHRGASVFFGRNEEDGLRCVYHGWKFDRTGACVDMPNEPPESNFKNKVRIGAYPCAERNGVIWAYMGPRSTAPPLPNLIWNLVPENPPFLWKHLRRCNWVQALEGDIDTAHLNFLHTRLKPADQTAPRSNRPGAVAMAKYNQDPHPVLEVVDTDYGVMYAGRRIAEEDTDYWRVSQFLFPFWTMPTGGAVEVGGKAWMPVDDDNTMVLEFRWDPAGPPSADDRARMAQFRNPHGHVPHTTDWLGRWRLKANRENDYLLDCELQKTALYCGILSNPLQDGAMQESMGPIYDRTQEHLGTTDAAIIRVRRRLFAAAKALRDLGVAPPAVDAPDLYRVRNHWALLPKGADWIEGTRQLVRDFSA